MSRKINNSKTERSDALHYKSSKNHDQTTSERIQQLETDFILMRKKMNLIDQTSRIQHQLLQQKISELNIPAKSTNDDDDKYDELKRLFENLLQQFTEIKQSIDNITFRAEHDHSSLEANDTSRYSTLPVYEGDMKKLEDKTDRTDEIDPESKGNEAFEHHFFPDDTFSYLAVADYFENYMPTTAFALAVFAVFVQVVTLTIFMADVVSFDGDNPLSVPPGVGIQVRVSQLIALLISCWNQDEIRSSLNILSLGYHEDIVSTISCGATRSKWYASIVVRIIVGAYTLLVTFILIINSDTVRDVMLDFAAVTFVSELDNGAFMLSYWGYMGRRLQALTMRMKAIPVVEEDSSGGNKRLRKIPRSVSLTFIIIIICTCWAWITTKQDRGDFMYQTINIQFGDDYSPAIGAFSGLYKLVLDSSNDGMRVNYVEVGMESATFSYCSQDSMWLFQYDSQPDGYFSDDFSSCWSRARSSVTDELDIINTASLAWYVFDDDLLLEMPLQHFAVNGRTSYYGQSCQTNDDCGDRMFCEESEKENEEDSKTCVCKDGLFGLNCEFPVPCRILDIDPRNEGFLGTRSWSSRFGSIREDGKESPLQVYGKPVYIGEVSMDGNFDVILFTGRRWILTDSNSIEDYHPLPDSSARNLALFLANTFHAYWSNYTFYFASEPVDVGTPIDSATPVGLNWFRIETSGTQGASLRSGVKIWQDSTTIRTKFFCAVCNNETNLCFYGASCSSDGTCECTTGSSGQLCQIAPDGNGHCDVFFNTPEFNFDGGDCCQETCMSTEEYTCGNGLIKNSAGVSAYGFIGYPNCEDPRFSSKLSGSKTLFEIVERGSVRCGGGAFPGFFDYSDGIYSGFEVDLCKSIAAAALGDPEAIEMVLTDSYSRRFINLAEGNFDVLIQQATHTAERDIFQSDAKTGFSFIPTPYFFDGLRYAGIPPFSECADELNVRSADCLDLKICVIEKSSWAEVTHELFPEFVIVEVGSHQAVVEGLEAGLCNVIAGEMTFVAEFAVRSRGFTGPTYKVGESVYSKEPLAAVTRQDDRVWFKFVSWVFEALIQAEESGITKLTADNLAPTDVFGDTFRNMFQNAVAANGNYGEIYEKNLEDKIPRNGLNNINRGGSGLIYAFPFGMIATHGLDPIVGGSIEAIRKRRVLNCGICRLPGFATLDSETGTWNGFDVDICRGIAAALFTGSTNVNFIAVTFPDRFEALADGTVDVMGCATTHTLTREVNEISTGVGFDFTPPIFYEGMGFGGVPPFVLCAEILDFSSTVLSPECPRTRICVVETTSWLETIRSQLNIPEVNIILTANIEETYDKFNSGECNVMAGETAHISESVIRERGYISDKEYYASERKFTKEPLAIVSRSDDVQFSDFLRWIIFGYFYAAEMKITKDEYFDMPASSFLFGNALSGMWRRAIEAVGNYDEMFERNFAAFSDQRGLNKLNDEGGPQFFAKPGVVLL